MILFLSCWLAKLGSELYLESNFAGSIIMDGCRLTMGVSIASSLHVFTNPESRQPHFFSMKYIVWFDQFQMDLYLRIIIEYQNANITVIFKEETIFFSKKQLQIKNSGFVKTCDEYVRRWRTCAAWTWSRLPCPAASSCPMATWTFCLFPANIKKEKNR